ncbi:MAG: tetratricopeptide repeat protein [Bacteroidota bacterium]
MKKKYISYVVILILIGIALNYLGIFGLGIWGMSEQIERDKRYRGNEVPLEELMANERYENLHKSTIDSLLKANPNEAIAYIDAIMPDYPEEDFLHIYKGKGFYSLDSFELAHGEFKKAMRKSGYEYPTALGNSGWALAKMERYDEAIAQFKKAIQTNSGYEYDLAQVYEMMGDFEKAITFYKKEIKEITAKDPLAAKIDPNILAQLKELNAKILELEKNL